MKRLFILLLIGYSCSAGDLVSAIHKVESSGRIGKILGDGGKALGPLQIHYKTWKDAVEFDKSIKGKYKDCSDLNYSKKIFIAYLNKYAAGKSLEERARIWNGGPQGHKKAETKKYWNKVKQLL